MADGGSTGQELVGGDFSGWKEDDQRWVQFQIRK